MNHDIYVRILNWYDIVTLAPNGLLQLYTSIMIGMVYSMISRHLSDIYRERENKNEYFQFEWENFPHKSLKEW